MALYPTMVDSTLIELQLDNMPIMEFCLDSISIE